MAGSLSKRRALAAGELGGIPVPQGLFRGTVHRREDGQLSVFIRPSTIAGDEVT